MNDYKIVIKSELFEKNHFLSVCSEDEICDVRKISGMNLWEWVCGFVKSRSLTSADSGVHSIISMMPLKELICDR